MLQQLKINSSDQNKAFHILEFSSGNIGKFIEAIDQPLENPIFGSNRISKHSILFNFAKQWICMNKCTNMKRKDLSTNFFSHCSAPRPHHCQRYEGSVCPGGNRAMLVALNIMRGVFGRFMWGIHGWYVRGGNKSGYAFGTDDSSQQFPHPPYVSSFSYYTTWHNIMLSASTCRSIGEIAANTF